MAAGEAKIESYLKLRVKQLGGRTRKVKWLCGNGAADRLVWWQFPAVGLIEVKAPEKDVDPRSLQAREVRRMREDGWMVFVVNSREQVDEALEKIRKSQLTT